jgi:predicted DNA-binding transcriptional regulator AlpA
MSVFGGSRVGYIEHEVENFIRSRIRAAGGATAAPLPPPASMRIISVKEAERRVGFSRVHLWRLEKIGKFPGRVRLNDGVAGDAA